MGDWAEFVDEYIHTLNEEELEYLNGLVLMLDPCKTENLQEFLRSYNNGHFGFLSVRYIHVVGVGCLLKFEKNPTALTIADKIRQYLNMYN